MPCPQPKVTCRAAEGRGSGVEGFCSKAGLARLARPASRSQGGQGRQGGHVEHEPWGGTPTRQPAQPASRDATPDALVQQRSI